MAMDLLQAIKERKSIRAFKPDPIPREKIEERKGSAEGLSNHTGKSRSPAVPEMSSPSLIHSAKEGPNPLN
jgi:hypothetical protein